MTKKSAKKKTPLGAFNNKGAKTEKNMKTISKKTLLFFAATALMAACASEDIEKQEHTGKQRLTTFQSGNVSPTRTTMEHTMAKENSFGKRATKSGSTLAQLLSAIPRATLRVKPIVLSSISPVRFPARAISLPIPVRAAPKAMPLPLLLHRRRVHPTTPNILAHRATAEQPRQLVWATTSSLC